MEELYWAAYECTTIVLESGAEKKMYNKEKGTRCTLAGLAPRKNCMGNLAALGQRVTP